MKYPRIRNLREDKDLNQKTLAEHLGVVQTAYSKYELGQLNMTPEILIKLAEFSVWITELLINAYSIVRHCGIIF